MNVHLPEFIHKNLKVEEVRKELNKKGDVKCNSDDEKQFQILEHIAR